MESNLVENINIQKCFSKSVRKLDGILSYLSRASVLGQSFRDGRREKDCKVSNSSDQDWRRYWYGNIKADQVKLWKHLRKSNQVWWLPHSLRQLAMHPVPPLPPIQSRGKAHKYECGLWLRGVVTSPWWASPVVSEVENGQSPLTHSSWELRSTDENCVEQCPQALH